MTQGATGLTDSAVRAVARLAAASGHPIVIPPTPKGSSSSMDRVIIIIAALAVLAGLRFRKRIWRGEPRVEEP